MELANYTPTESNGQAGHGVMSKFVKSNLNFYTSLMVTILPRNDFQSCIVLGKNEYLSLLVWMVLNACYHDAECDAKLTENFRWARLNGILCVQLFVYLMTMPQPST